MHAQHEHPTPAFGGSGHDLLAFLAGRAAGMGNAGLLDWLPPPPPPPPARPGKRSRAAGDIDGEDSCVQKKKRRLRLLLTTSPLSPPFSHPATHIVDRGSSRIAAWAKQKALGRHLLRKTAILNHVRCCSPVASGRTATLEPSAREQAVQHEQIQLAARAFIMHAIPLTAAGRTGTRSVYEPSPPPAPPPSSPPSSLPSSPPSPLLAMRPSFRSPNEAYASLSPRRDSMLSPLGLSNYDALDVEDESCEDACLGFDEAGENGLLLDPHGEEAAGDADDDDVPFSPSAAYRNAGRCWDTLDDTAYMRWLQPRVDSFVNG